jgi:hypothetical protein
MLLNLKHFGGMRGVLELQDGIKTNSQTIVQDEINLHNPKKRVVSASEWKWWGRFSKDSAKHKIYMACNLWEEAPLPSL